MDVLEAIARRRSVREYRPEPIPQEVLLTLLDAAHQAPSSWNLQPWEFVVVTSPEAKEALLPTVTENNRAVVQQAGAIFVCLGSMRQQNALADRIEARIPPDADPERRERAMAGVRRHRYDEQFRKDHVLHSTYIGVTQLSLAAEQFGLGSLWMGGFSGDKVKAALNIPEDYLVAVLLAVGYPREGYQPKPRVRRPLEEIYRFNTWS